MVRRSSTAVVAAKCAAVATATLGAGILAVLLRRHLRSSATIAKGSRRLRDRDALDEVEAPSKAGRKQSTRRVKPASSTAGPPGNVACAGAVSRSSKRRARKARRRRQSSPSGAAGSAENGAAEGEAGFHVEVEVEETLPAVSVGVEHDAVTEFEDASTATQEAKATEDLDTAEESAAAVSVGMEQDALTELEVSSVSPSCDLEAPLSTRGNSDISSIVASESSSAAGDGREVHRCIEDQLAATWTTVSRRRDRRVKLGAAWSPTARGKGSEPPTSPPASPQRSPRRFSQAESPRHEITAHGAVAAQSVAGSAVALASSSPTVAAVDWDGGASAISSGVAAASSSLSAAPTVREGNVARTRGPTCSRAAASTPSTATSCQFTRSAVMSESSPARVAYHIPAAADSLGNLNDPESLLRRPDVHGVGAVDPAAKLPKFTTPSAWYCIPLHDDGTSGKVSPKGGLSYRVRWTFVEVEPIRNPDEKLRRRARSA